MKNIFEQLTNLLKKDERLVSQDGILLKNQTQELVRKNDPELIKILISDKTTKQHFFFEVEKTLIFDKEKFIRFISNKQFLPDSYTAFKNKIGLTAGDEYVSENKEVVLAWPYKDCVLEGGMTKEDQKRDEIFYNETLAPDDINRLLDAKVFTNFKRIDKKGEHRLDGFKRNEKGTIKDNLIIKGNNLLALASLKKEFGGKIQLIYIDPPFNTDKDSFRYNDRFNHSSWLTFIKDRLKIAKELLAPSGLIYIQLDYNEAHYFKVLCDEVFGRDKFVNEVIWGYRIQGVGKGAWPKKHDNIFIYCKTDNYKFYPEKEIVKYEKPFIDTQVIAPDLSLLSEKDRKVILDALKNNKPIPDRYKDKLFNKYFAEVYVRDVWDHDMTKPLISGSNEFLDFRTQKPEGLLQRIINSATREGEIVLDFFGGSGTTASVAHKLRRQYITVEQIDGQLEILKNRLKSVIQGEQEGISEQVDWKGGGDFVYMELAIWNKEWIEKIEKAKTGKELAKLWVEMKETAFLSYKVDPKIIDENAKDFADLTIADQKKFLIECLDKNQLYVNLSEIEDKEYGVSKEDIKLNKEFYK